MSVIYNANPWSSGHGYQPSFQDIKLPYLKTKSEAEVRALENTQDYKDFTWYAGGGYNTATGEQRVGELANRNSEFTKQYIQALVQNLEETSPDSFEVDANGNKVYKGIKIGTVPDDADASVLQQDENGYYINIAAWLKARGDGKHGFIHDFKIQPSTPLASITPPGGPDAPIASKPYKNPFDPNLDIPLTFNKPEHIPWTDWIPHTMQLMNAHAANSKLTKLQKQMSFPKHIAPQKHAIVTDAYAQRQLLEKQKQELLARADATQVSNIEQKMAIMRQAEEQADKYSDAQVQLQSQEYAQTKKDANDVANWNLVKRAEIADHNAKVNSAAYNNWLNAEKQKVTSDSAARKSYLYDMYKDYGLYKQDQRLNERAQKESQIKLALSDKLTQLGKIHSQMTDPSTWQFLSQYAVEFVLQGDESGLSTSDIQLINSCHGDANKVVEVLTNNARLRDLIVSKLLTGQDEVSKSYRAAYESEKARLEKDYDNAYNAAYRQYEGARAALPVTVSNQIFKKGGKLKVLQEIVKQNQKEKESNRKASSDFHKRTSKELARQLGALDKEQLMLLKSIFS